MSMVCSDIYLERQKPTFGEILFAVFVLFFSTGAIVPLVRKESGVIFDPVHGDLVLQGLWLVLYGITFFLMFKHFRQVAPAACRDRLVWLLVGLALVSVLWSWSPPVTLRRCMALIGSTVFGIYLASRFTWQDMLKCAAWALGLGAVLSLGFVLFLPSYGIHHDIYHSGAWRGIYFHKNVLGRFMTLASTTWLLYSFSNSRVYIAGLALFGLSLELLFLSTSKTSIIIFLMLLPLLLIYLYRIGRTRQILPVISIILVTGSIALFLVCSHNTTLNFGHAKEITAPGQLPEVDLTLTGRTALWQAVLEKIQQQPWLGYGYSAFWLGSKEPSGHLWRILAWETPNAHNGYLDLWLQIGLVGLVIFMISFITNIFRTLFLAREKKSTFALFAMIFLLILLINNVTESFILVQNCIFWILYVAVSVKISSDYAGKKQELGN